MRAGEGGRQEEQPEMLTPNVASSTETSGSHPAGPAGDSVSRVPGNGFLSALPPQPPFDLDLRKHGYTVQSEVRDDLQPVRAEHKVPDDAASCHTVLIDGYAVEGHVPIEAIDMLLGERPTIDGIGIPGMPTNAPGMGRPSGWPIEVLSFSDGNVQPFATL